MERIISLFIAAFMSAICIGFFMHFHGKTRFGDLIRDWRLICYKKYVEYVKTHISQSPDCADKLLSVIGLAWGTFCFFGPLLLCFSPKHLAVANRITTTEIAIYGILNGVIQKILKHL